MSSHHSSTPLSTRSQKSKTRRPRDSSPIFTPRMQDAQARNKEPLPSDSSDETGGRFDSWGNPSFEEQQAREEAAAVLDSPELLMMHAEARNDSIPGTRYYFTKMLCGYLEEKDTYEAQRAPPVEKEGKKDKESAKQVSKGKKREGGAS